MEIPLYVIDAFASRVFKGNPAAVCPLESWLDDELMQSIASENNLSETAFLVPAGDNAWELRWFTPTVEVDLCGHATLASAFVLSMNKHTAAPQYLFHTKSGPMQVKQEKDWLTLDFPGRDLQEIEDKAAVLEESQAALGMRPANIVQSASTLIAEFEDEQTIRSLTPDFQKIKALEFRAVIVTARGDHCDFVSRFFAPRVGIAEDPVTGSAHSSLIPYWHRLTGKNELLANQVSQRGGVLRCKYKGERVEISGQAVLFSQGKICL